jgi:hypothetical protein
LIHKLIHVTNLGQSIIERNLQTGQKHAKSLHTYIHNIYIIHTHTHICLHELLTILQRLESYVLHFTIYGGMFSHTSEPVKMSERDLGVEPIGMSQMSPGGTRLLVWTCQLLSASLG